jgi:hypothetical protein
MFDVAKSPSTYKSKTSLFILSNVYIYSSLRLIISDVVSSAKTFGKCLDYLKTNIAIDTSWNNRN